MAHLQSRCQEPNICLCEHLTSNLFVINLIDLTKFQSLAETFPE